MDNAEAPMTTITCCSDSSARLADRPTTTLTKHIGNIAAWLRERRTRRELARLPDYLLNDIGLTRTGSGFTRARETRPLYRAELFGDHLYRMTREKQQ
jgi:uncharacterized protein YjiS (DUF1127 family)